MKEKLEALDKVIAKEGTAAKHIQMDAALFEELKAYFAANPDSRFDPFGDGTYRRLPIKIKTGSFLVVVSETDKGKEYWTAVR